MDEDLSDNGDTAREINALIEAKLKSMKYEEKVKEKFASMSSKFDNSVAVSMRNTQKIFDEILESVDALQSDQKLFRKQLNTSIADSADVIVLTDDDDDNPRSSRTEQVVNTADLLRQRLRSTQSPSQLTLEEPSNEKSPDPYGIRIGCRVLGKKHRAEWFPGTVIGIQTQNGKNRYKVRFDDNRSKIRLTANHLAKFESARSSANGQIPVGSRIAAHYKNEGIYSGIVAEAPDRRINRGRFLIFFDDGYAMYCSISTVYLVYGPPANVWEDISYKETAEYIKEYLSASDHPLLTLRSNQVLRVEFQGEWHEAKCANIDSSLVEVMYLIDSSREWIYRGSLRLEPLYKQCQAKTKALLNKSQKRLARAHTGVRSARIEYATIDLTRDSSPSPSNSPVRQYEDKKKNIGKKSTGGVQRNHSSDNSKSTAKGWLFPWERRGAAGSFSSVPVVKLPQSYSELNGRVDVASTIMDRMELKQKNKNTSLDTNDDVILSEDTASDVSWRKSTYGAKAGTRNSLVSAPYSEHTCSRKCIKNYKLCDPTKLIGMNPLEKPLHLGWTREVSKKHPSSSKGSMFHIYYRAPCGRMCRNMNDIDRYMVQTGLVDLDYTEFCFDQSIRIFSNIEVRPRYAKFFLEDYSGGKENVPVPCVNEISTEPPPKMPYTKQRVPGIGVKIETSLDYMLCCDCPDNCRDRSKCPCQQLTVTATTCCKGGRAKCDAGYVYKRLHNFLPTGIYECNRNCKCNSGCQNRVVQHGLQCRLQMFKTHKKGWGIRCLDDIAKGTFVCIYTGKIQNEEQANKDGLANGDEYLAELDHIEVAERQKGIDDAASSSGISEDEEFEDDKKDRRPKTKSDDSGAETTDSESDEEEKTKHVTVTLKRASDSRWTVEQKSTQNVQTEGIRHAVKHGAAKKNFTNGRKRSKGPDKSSSDTDNESSNTISRNLAPPKRNEDDVDCYTTDTDTDSSLHSRPSSAGPPSHRRHDTSSQNIRLNSSQVSSFDDMSDDEGSISQTRKYFGTADTFIIDAKQIGNLGRYLNHSCSPNLLVQNVFIDTHDLRFPWVAFFASTTIRAGTELTWDYNYEIGSVEGREIVCYCGATKCRKRLL